MFCRKLQAQKLRAMINLMLSDTKLKAIADSVGIAPSNAYLWRMKAYMAARIINGDASLSDKAWIDEKLIPVNSFIAEPERYLVVHTACGRNASTYTAHGRRSRPR